MGAQVIELEDGVNGYVDLVRRVLDIGRESAPRGKKTLEIEDAVVTIGDIYHTLPLGVGRGAVPGIGAVEACQLLGGESRPKLVVAVGPQFANFQEDNGLFHGAYGLRTSGQYASVVERLMADPDTRQAVVTIWNPEYDLLPNKRDYPCTILHQFRIRNNRLNMSVYMRSNDVWLGAAYDFFQFTRVQLAISSILGITPGTYAHHVGSLHIYEQHYAAADQLRYTEPEDYADIPVIMGTSWGDVQNSARDALDAAEELDSSLLDYSYGDRRDIYHNDKWYADAMISAIKKNQSKDAK